MCSNQLGRRNITDEQRTYLLGKLYEARKNTIGGDRGNQYTKVAGVENRHMASPSGNKTRATIAAEQSTTESAVRDASFYAKGLDEAEKGRFTTGDQNESCGKSEEFSRDQNDLSKKQFRLFSGIKYSAVFAQQICKYILHYV